MTESANHEMTTGYPRELVEDYIKTVAVQQLELEADIAAAQARIDRVVEIEHRIAALENQIGHWMVAAYSLTRGGVTAPLISPAAGTVATIDVPAESSDCSQGEVASSAAVGDIDCQETTGPIDARDHEEPTLVVSSASVASYGGGIGMEP